MQAIPFTASEEEELRKMNAAGPLRVPQSSINVAAEASAPAKQLFAASRRPNTAQGSAAARPMNDEAREAASQLDDIFASWDVQGRGLLARFEFEKRLRELSQVRIPEEVLSELLMQSETEPEMIDYRRFSSFLPLPAVAAQVSIGALLEQPPAAATCASLGEPLGKSACVSPWATTHDYDSINFQARYTRAGRLEQIRALFKTFDIDGSGRLETSEFLKVMGGFKFFGRARPFLNNEQMEELLLALDVDRSGSVDINEFINHLADFRETGRLPLLLQPKKGRSLGVSAALDWTPGDEKLRR